MTPAPKDFDQRALKLHKQHRGKLQIEPTVPLKTKDDLSLAYTPGVAAVSRAIAERRERAYDLTIKGNSVAVVSDGSAVLGLGKIGPEAALPVMEGKAALFKKFADIDAYPIVLDTWKPDQIVRTVKAIATEPGRISIASAGTFICTIASRAASPSPGKRIPLARSCTSISSVRPLLSTTRGAQPAW